MKYLIIGTGGIGGALGGFLAHEGYDVTLIARGAHLDSIKNNGLTVKSGIKGEFCVKNAKACTSEEYNDTPDVIFVCVKGYSLDDAEKLIAKCANGNTIVIPLLNIFGTGSELQRRLPKIHILDGCIYITSYISAPGEITQGGKLFKIVFGERDGSKSEKLEKIAEELSRCGIKAELTDDIRRLCFKKYALISSMAAVGAYYDAAMGEICADSAKKETFIGLSREIEALAEAMEIPFEEDIVGKNLHMIETAAPDTTASMQKDLKKGGKSEIDGLVFEPVRLGRRYNVPTPNFAMIAKKFGFEL